MAENLEKKEIDRWLRYLSSFSRAFCSVSVSLIIAFVISLYYSPILPTVCSGTRKRKSAVSFGMG
jgi:hypothetical protein